MVRPIDTQNSRYESLTLSELQTSTSNIDNFYVYLPNYSNNFDDKLHLIPTSSLQNQIYYGCGNHSYNTLHLVIFRTLQTKFKSDIQNSSYAHSRVPTLVRDSQHFTHRLRPLITYASQT